MAKLPKQSFTQEFRQQAVKSVVEMPEAACRLNMSAKTLANWVHKSRSGAWDAGQSGKAVCDIEAENSRLRRELAEGKKGSRRAVGRISEASSAKSCKLIPCQTTDAIVFRAEPIFSP